jgi:hypothetical protein
MNEPLQNSLVRSYIPENGKKKTWELYFTHSWVGNALANPENSKNREKPLKFVYRKSLDNIELLPFDHCSVCAGTLMFDISACEIDNLTLTLW